MLDDLFTYRLSENSFLTVTNAANHERDLAWMRSHGEEFDADVTRLPSTTSRCSPFRARDARALVESLADGALPPRMHCCERTVADVPLLVCGTGYTGEDGVELLLDPDEAVAVWDGADRGRCRARSGSGARDTLRLEACFHLYGNDLSEDHDPIGAGLGWACREETGFIGADAISKVRAQRARTEAGSVRDRRTRDRASGQPGRSAAAWSPAAASRPSLERGIGMAYVSADRAAPGTRFQIDVRGTLREAIVETKPLYRKER